MKRREFLGVLGGAVSCPMLAQAKSKGSPSAGAARPDDQSGRLEPLLPQAQQLGAPVTALQRAAAISRQPTFVAKDAFAVFDISQPSASKRFYLVDLRSGQITAHHSAHGSHARATKFKGFQRDLDMVPLGPLKTMTPETMAHYSTIMLRWTVPSIAT